MSRDHPEADGLAERVVQMVKRALHKYGLQKGHLGDWDIQSPWLAMGYRFSHQASLASFSPYFLLYSRNIDLPTTIHRESNEVVNLDDPEMWLTVCHSYDILGAGMLWKPKEARILTNFIDQPVNIW
jgi:hypothetical protein